MLHWRGRRARNSAVGQLQRGPSGGAPAWPLGRGAVRGLAARPSAGAAGRPSGGAAEPGGSAGDAADGAWDGDMRLGGSAALLAASRADGLVRVPRDLEGLEAGAEVWVEDVGP